MLRPSLCGRDDQPTWTMDQTHPCLHTVPILPPRSTGNKEFFCTITFERCTVRWIHFHCNHLLLETRIPQAGHSKGRNAQRTTVLSRSVSSASSTSRICHSVSS